VCICTFSSAVHQASKFIGVEAYVQDLHLGTNVRDAKGAENVTWKDGNYSPAQLIKRCGEAS